MTHQGWEHYAHEADMGVRGKGACIADAFAQAAMALTAIITDPARVEPRERIEIRCEAPDRELLFVDFINALIFEMAARRMLFSRFDVELAANALVAYAWGEKVDQARHQPTVETKGATYTDLKLYQNADGQWQVQCVIDV